MFEKYKLLIKYHCYTNSYIVFYRIIAAGRQVGKQCKRAYNSATERIQETKSNCSIQ